MAKYPSLGILDEFEKMLHGTSTRQALREPLFGRVKDLYDVDRSSFSRVLYDLRKRGYVSYKSDNAVSMTTDGFHHVDLMRLKKIKWKVKESDHYHRLIMFDIPEDCRSARDIFRSKLKEFECRQIQKSVYLTRYKCEHIIEKLAEVLEIGKYVRVLKIADFGKNSRS